MRRWRYGGGRDEQVVEMQKVEMQTVEMQIVVEVEGAIASPWIVTLRD